MAFVLFRGSIGRPIVVSAMISARFIINSLSKIYLENESDARLWNVTGSIAPTNGLDEAIHNVSILLVGFEFVRIV